LPSTSSLELRTVRCQAEVPHQRGASPWRQAAAALFNFFGKQRLRPGDGKTADPNTIEVALPATAALWIEVWNPANSAELL
jgi:hypothetical protein